jgi:phosphoesterase RecJ-like protein
MEITPDQQIFEYIKKSNKILVLLPQALTEDGLASGLAFKLFLDKLQKDVVLVSGGELPENLKFLPATSSLQKEISTVKSFVITVDTSAKKLEEVSYQSATGKVSIYLKSKSQEFAPEDLSFSSEKFPVDLIVALDAASMEDFGKIFEQHADLFFETPKINIDNKASNGYFGTVNLVDVTATSVAEILTELLHKYEDQLVDEDIATCLLAGIIAKTHSFQHVHTTPRSFLKASELVSLGARQQEIIKYIYKTKSLSLLKLWGRALARMRINEQTKIIYSVLTTNDFEKAESSELDLLPTLREFVENLNGYRIVALLAEPTKGNLRLVAAVHEQVIPENFAQNLEGKIIDVTLGNYKIVERVYTEQSLEDIEKSFLTVAETTSLPLGA